MTSVSQFHCPKLYTPWFVRRSIFCLQSTTLGFRVETPNFKLSLPLPHPPSPRFPLPLSCRFLKLFTTFTHVALSTTTSTSPTSWLSAAASPTSNSSTSPQPSTCVLDPSSNQHDSSSVTMPWSSAPRRWCAAVQSGLRLIYGVLVLSCTCLSAECCRFTARQRKRWVFAKKRCHLSLCVYIMKGGTQGFPRHEVSDKQEVLLRRRFAVYGIFNSSTQFVNNSLTNWKCRRRRNVFEQNFLFVAHFVSGKPLCPALHNIKMRVSSKKSFTLLLCVYVCTVFRTFPFLCWAVSLLLQYVCCVCRLSQYLTPPVTVSWTHLDPSHAPPPPPPHRTQGHRSLWFHWNKTCQEDTLSLLVVLHYAKSFQVFFLQSKGRGEMWI